MTRRNFDDRCFLATFEIANALIRILNKPLRSLDTT